MIYKDLDVYQRAYRLALEIHQFSLTLSKELQFDLADQIRRASRSIPFNIAEGFGKQNSKLEFLKDSNLISEPKYLHLSEEYIICGKQLNKLIASLLVSK